MTKRILWNFLFVFFLFWAGSAFGARMLARVFVDTRAQAEKIATMPFDFATRHIGRYADIVVDERDFSIIRKLGLRYEILDSDLNRTFAEHVTGPTDMGLYHTVQEMYTELQAVHQAYPDITYLTSIGQSIEGRDIMAIKVSDNAAVEEGEPEVLYGANIHAREIITPEVVLYFLNYLVTNYGIDSTVTDIVDNRQLWIIPTMNPDGHVYVEEQDKWWRKNRRDNGDGSYGVDLNRNFSYKWGYDNQGSSPSTSSEVYRGTGPFSEPETQAIRDFVMAHHFVAAFTYHSYGNLLLFPWGYKKANTEHHDIFLSLADELVAENGYRPGNYFMGVIYKVNGDTDDYYYGERNDKDMIFGYTTEVGSDADGFFPPDALIPKFVEENLSANIRLAQVADILADNPWRMLHPNPPTAHTVPADDDGNITISWNAVPDSVNPALSYDVKEIQGYRTIIDSAESEGKSWDFDGFTRSSEKSASGSFSYYSGLGNRIQTSMTTLYSLMIDSTQTLTFKTWYDIEKDYDYAYVEVSTDNGLTFQPIAGNITTDIDPNGNNQGHGITGKSLMWKRAVFDLSDFAGQNILIRFRYVTDDWTFGKGFFIDDISPVTVVDTTMTLVEDYADTSMILQKELPGEFGYQVRSIDREGQKSGWSDILKVRIDFGDKGDVLKDGTLNDGDVLRCAEIALGLGRQPTNGELYRADMDSTGVAREINILDVIKLIRLIENR